MARGDVGHYTHIGTATISATTSWATITSDDFQDVQTDAALNDGLKLVRLDVLVTSNSAAGELHFKGMALAAAATPTGYYNVPANVLSDEFLFSSEPTSLSHESSAGTIGAILRGYWVA